MNSAIGARSLHRALLSVAVAFGLSAPALADSYTITDLGALLGNTSSSALGINNRGDVVVQTGGLQGYVYSSSTGTMAPVNSTASTAPLTISNTGYVTGVVDVGGGLEFGRPFLYSNGVYTPLSVGSLGQSYGRSVNDAGQVAGSGYFEDPADAGVGRYRGFVYDNGTVVQLGTLGGRDSYAWGINNNGQVAGLASDKNNSNHLALFDQGAVIDLGVCKGCGVFEINDSGQFVGYRNTDTGLGDTPTHGFLYAGGQVRDLGTLGGVRSQAFGINEQGQVVGYSNVAGQSTDVWRAFIYSNDTMIDLNNLIAPDSGWVLTHARDINDNGQIVGYGLVGGQQHAFLLTPSAVPVPTAAWLFGSGLMGLWGLARRRRG